MIIILPGHSKAKPIKADKMSRAELSAFPISLI